MSAHVSIPAADSYQPYKGVLEDGSEVLAQCYFDDAGRLTTLHVAFRAKPHHTWGPPTQLERAP